MLTTAEPALGVPHAVVTKGFEKRVAVRNVESVSDPRNATNDDFCTAVRRRRRGEPSLARKRTSSDDNACTPSSAPMSTGDASSPVLCVASMTGATVV